MQEVAIKKNISILTHVLGWALIGAVLFILSPLSAGVDRPDEFWFKAGADVFNAVWYILF
jgi:two-component system, LytTR family, sensor kinase